MCTGKTKKSHHLHSSRRPSARVPLNAAVAAATAASPLDAQGDGEPALEDAGQQKAQLSPAAAAPLATAIVAPDADAPPQAAARNGNDGEQRRRAQRRAPEPPARDREAERMSIDNTLKEVPSRMPECEFTHVAEISEPIFTNEQLL